MALFGHALANCDLYEWHLAEPSCRGPHQHCPCIIVSMQLFVCKWLRGKSSSRIGAPGFMQLCLCGDCALTETKSFVLVCVSIAAR